MDARQNGQGTGLASRKEMHQNVLAAHFHPLSLEEITVSERKFPFRVRVDLQRAIDRLFVEGTAISFFCGIQKEYPSDFSFSSLLMDGNNPCVAVPPEYEEVDIGEEKPIRCLKTGLWLLEQEGRKYAVLLTPAGHFHQITGVQFHIATPNSKDGFSFHEKFFKHLEDSVLKSESYRGKVLSLEMAEHSYSGESTGITVHRLRTVTQEQVILPKKPWTCWNGTSSTLLSSVKHWQDTGSRRRRAFCSTAHPALARRILSIISLES